MKGMGAISDVAATAAKCSGTPRGMHAPPMVDACSRTARHPPSREMTGVGKCGCKNAGGQKCGRRIRPSGTVAAVGRSKLQHWRCCSRHGRRPSSRERKGIGLGGCKNRHAVGLGVGKAVGQRPQSDDSSSVRMGVMPSFRRMPRILCMATRPCS